MVEALKRIDYALAELRQSGARQQVMLQVVLQMLLQQAETNSTIMRRLENRENRLDDLEKPSPD